MLVLRLIRLRDRLEAQGDSAALGLFAAVLALERVLYLTPQQRRDRLKLAVTDPPAAVSAPAGDSRLVELERQPADVRARTRPAAAGLT